MLAWTYLETYVLHVTIALTSIDRYLLSDSHFSPTVCFETFILFNMVFFSFVYQLSSVCCIFMAYDSSACELLMIAHLINWLPKQHNKSASWRKRVAGTRLGAQLIKCSWRMTTCVLHIKQLHQLCMPLWLQFSWLTQPISLIFVWCFVGMISWKLWKKRLNVKSSLEEYFFSLLQYRIFTIETCCN